MAPSSTSSWWQPLLRPKSFLGLTSIQSGTKIIACITIFNKFTAIYGLLGVLTGYSLSALQLVFFIYNILAVVLFLVCFKHITYVPNSSPLPNIFLAWLYIVDTFLSAAFTAALAGLWLRALPPTQPDQEGVGWMSSHETGASLALVAVFTLSRFYLCAVVMAHASAVLRLAGENAKGLPQYHGEDSFDKHLREIEEKEESDEDEAEDGDEADYHSALSAARKEEMRQDLEHQFQLMLLEKQAKKRQELARQEQDPDYQEQAERHMEARREYERIGMSSGQMISPPASGLLAGSGVVSFNETSPTPKSNHALQDYQMQLMLLEQQNKKRLMMARHEQNQEEAAAAEASRDEDDNPFAETKPSGQGWKGKMGRGMVSVGKGYWLGGSDEARYTRVESDHED